MTAPRDIRAAATVEAEGSTATTTKLRGVAYSGGVLMVAGYSRGVVVDLGTLEVPSDPLPLQWDHGTSLAERIGSVTLVASRGRLLATGTVVGGTPQADRVAALLRDGGCSLSIVARPGRVVAIAAGQQIKVNGRTFAGPAEVAYESRLIEVSAVGVPGDPDARAIAAKRKDSLTDMEPQENNQTPPPAPAAVIASIGPVEAERKRIRSIMASFANIGDDAERDRLIESGASTAEANAVALRILRASRAPAGGPVTLAASHAANDQRTLAASAARMLGASDKALIAAKLPVDVDPASSMLDLAGQCIRASGRDVPRASDAVIRAAFSSDSFTPALAEALEIVAMESFQTAPEAALRACRPMSVPDFMPATIARLMGRYALEEVAGSGELKHGQTTGHATTVKVATYGRIVTVTRQDLVNDKGDFLSGIPRELGLEAARKVGDLFASTIANTTFFHTNNNNVMTGTDAALSVASLGEAIRKLRVQTDDNGRALNLFPAYLIVSAALEGVARQVLTSTSLGVVDGGPTANPWLGAAELLVEPRLPPKHWYLTSDPVNAAFVKATLSGNETPRVEAVELPADVLGTGWRCFYDVAIGLHEPKAAVRSLGE